MDGVDRSIWFLGDLDDPQVAGILSAIPNPARIHTLACSGDLPMRPYDRGAPPKLVILHRSRLTGPDLVQLADWRGSRSDVTPRIILCYSPYVRYDELERAARLTDITIPEATACELLPRQLRIMLGDESLDSRPVPAGVPTVEVISSNPELLAVVIEACQAAGYRAMGFRDVPLGNNPSGGTQGDKRSAVLTIWDVPVLEPRWPELLRQRSKLGPVISLLGFADRETVSRARSMGSAVCLDVPFDPEDLIEIVNRLSTMSNEEGVVASAVRVEPAHSVPPAPAGQAISGRRSSRSIWPDDDHSPRITKPSGELGQ